MLKIVLTLLLLLTTGFGSAMAAEDLTFSGEVTYRQRIALPENAQLRVTLVSLTADGPRPIAGATALLAAPGQVPLSFAFDVRSNVVAAGGNYGLSAEILSGNTVVFRDAAPVPVNLQAIAPVIIVVQPLPVPTDPVATLDIMPTIFETEWVVDSIGGTPVLATAMPTLSIAPEGRAGGHGSCNSYFSEAAFADNGLKFGPVAGTRMACAPDIMAQEAALFAALAATAGYEIKGNILHLNDAGGTALVVLHAAQ
jgi:putative lipoprotein